jgi:hypothetical protein
LRSDNMNKTVRLNLSGRAVRALNKLTFGRAYEKFCGDFGCRLGKGLNNLLTPGIGGHFRLSVTCDMILVPTLGLRSYHMSGAATCDVTWQRIICRSSPPQLFIEKQ